MQSKAQERNSAIARFMAEGMRKKAADGKGEKFADAHSSTGLFLVGVPCASLRESTVHSDALVLPRANTGGVPPQNRELCRFLTARAPTPSCIEHQRCHSLRAA